jgi:hypothetical protein
MALTKEDLQAIAELMDGKMFSLESKMDEKMSSLESKMDEKMSSLESKMDEKFEAIKADIADLKLGQQVIRESQLTVETVWLPKIGAAMDGFQLNRDHHEELEERVVFLEKKADIHDTRLFVLERDIKAE